MIGCIILGIALILLLMEMVAQRIEIIRQREVASRAKRGRWICRPEGCVEIPTDWDSIMERTQLDRDSAQ